ncbi:MAG: T9SS type A sorting domain-containing protein [Fibrobacteres bacterium]|nr:T9SS type A sorting domain-containing protein [Fibrobacterota bacterium]
MRFMLAVMVAASMLLAQSYVNGTSTQVCSYSGESNNNAGGKGSCRVGKDPDYYRMLSRFDLGSRVPKMPCTLYVRQYKYTSSNVTYNYDDGEFETRISTIPGTWVTGSATETAQEGSVCHRYRAYSASTPTPWVAGNNASTLLDVINGNGGSHNNSVGLTIRKDTAIGGVYQLCYAVLDQQMLVDLLGGMGGLAITRAAGGGGEIRFYTNSAKLSWDPNGTAVSGVEKYMVVGSSLKIAANPNPFTSSSVITYGTAANLPVQVYGISGALIATLNGVNGKAMWNGCDVNGNTLPNGAYVIKIADGKDVKSQTISIVR